MSRFKIPADWKAPECMDAITTLLRECTLLCTEGKYDKGAKLLVLAANIMREIPIINRKENNRKSANDKIKKSREPKVNKAEETPRPTEDVLPNNPFKPNGN